MRGAEGSDRAVFGAVVRVFCFWRVVGNGGT